MSRARKLWRHLSTEWPRWAQVGGVLLGSEQVAAWVIGGQEPNVGAMTFAGALLMFQRIANRKDDDP
jgi:hypothetical protein